VFKQFSDEPGVFAGDFGDRDAMSKFVKDESLVTFGQISQTHQDVLQSFMETKRPKLILIVKGEDEAFVKDVQAGSKAAGVAATHFVGWVDGPAFPQAMQHFEVEEGDLPAARVYTPDGKKFKMAGTFGAKECVQFAQDVASGKVQPFIKSEAVPADNNKPVKVVVRNNLDEILADDSDLFLKVYAPWCGHCKAMAPTWEQLGSALAKENSVTIAKVDATANDLPDEWGVQGFPTLLFFPKGSQKPIEFDQQARDFESLLKYVKAKASSKSLNVDDNVAPPPAPAAADTSDDKDDGDDDTVAHIVKLLNRKYMLDQPGYVWAAVASGLLLLSMFFLGMAFSGPVAPPPRAGKAPQAKKSADKGKSDAATKKSSDKAKTKGKTRTD